MILSEVRDYLAQRGCAPLSDMVNRFRIEPDALRAMLDVWIAKGRIRRTESEKPCGGCCGCGSAPEMYEWLGRR